MKETKTSSLSAEISQDLCRVIVDNIPYPAWFKDDKGRYVFVNTAFLSFFNVSRQVILLRKDGEVFPTELASGYAAKDGVVVSEAKEIRAPEIVEKSHGERMRVETTRTPVCNSEGKVIGVTGIMRPLGPAVESTAGATDGSESEAGPGAGTPGSNAEEDLRHAEEKYRNIFENAVEGIFQARTDGRIISANPALARILGRESAEDLIRSGCEMGSHVYVSEKRYKEYLHLMETEGMVRDFEAQFQCRDGTVQWVSINARTVADSDGYPLYYEGTAESITERKKLEGQLRQAQKMESVGTLAGGIAHDFNNVLTTIMGYCSLIMMKAGKGNPVLGYIDQIMEAANRASTLTQSLLSFSRKQVTELKTVDINETIRSVEKLLRRIIGEDIELQTTLCSERLHATVGDGQVGQLLMNLATNARDAMPEGGVLNIKTEQAHLSADFMKRHEGREGIYAAIEVSDTGKGMDERTKDKVFDPFFTTKEVGKGTGLGLSIVYGIVKQNKGYINISSEPGKGASFTVYLPLAENSSDAGSLLRKADLRGGNETILVAEDNIQVREIVTTTLRDFGYNVIEAFDGADAIDKFRELRTEIDLLLLDVIMPRKNGKEAYLEIKRMRPDIRAIFMSGYTGDILTRKGISRVGIPMISKPIVIEKLLKEIRDVLDKSPSQLTLFP